MPIIRFHLPARNLYVSCFSGIENPECPGNMFPPGARADYHCDKYYKETDISATGAFAYGSAQTAPAWQKTK
jgi:hypothetical protein